MSSVRIAVWDMDGTLTDTMYIWHNLSREFLRARNVTPGKDLEEKLTIMGVRSAAHFLGENFSIGLSGDEIYRQLIGLLCEYYRTNTIVKPGVREVLHRLRRMDIPCILLSATPSEGVDTALEAAGLKEFFDGNIFSCEALGLHKSDPETFHMVCRKFNAEPGECMVFEDALYAIKGAKSAGCRVCAVNDRFEVRQSDIRAIADCYVNSWEEFSADFLNN